VFDQNYRNRYIFAGLQPGQRIPLKWMDSGVIIEADTLEELATRPAYQPTSFIATVQRFNSFAAQVSTPTTTAARAPMTGTTAIPPTGQSELGEIRHAPFFAAKMVPGDLGTKGGIRTDVHGRALRDDGSIIEACTPQVMSAQP